MAESVPGEIRPSGFLEKARRKVAKFIERETAGKALPVVETDRNFLATRRDHLSTLESRLGERLARKTPDFITEGQMLLGSYARSSKSLADYLSNGELSLSEAQERDEGIFSIAAEGQLGGISVSELLLPQIFDQKSPQHKDDLTLLKSALMRIFIKNPEMARRIVKERIVAGHGSTSASLLGVLEHGLKPQRYLDEMGLLVASGEHRFAGSKGNAEYISLAVLQNFDQLVSWAKTKGEINEDGLMTEIQMIEERMVKMPEGSFYKEGSKLELRRKKETLAFLRKEGKTEDEKLMEVLIRANFPVVYLVNGQGISKENTKTHFGDIPGEFAIKGGREKNQIPILLVPKIEMTRVSEIAKARKFQASIFPVEDLEANL